MSINALLNDDSTKGWSNLYVNSLTTYKDLTVKGELKFESASGGPRVFTQTFRKSSAVITNVGFETIKFLEVGGLVTCFIPEFTFLCTQANPLILTPSFATPAKYLPNVETVFSIRILTDLNTLVQGYIECRINGDFVIFPSYLNGPSFNKAGFTSNNTVGTLRNHQITYINKVANP